MILSDDDLVQFEVIRSHFWDTKNTNMQRKNTYNFTESATHSLNFIANHPTFIMFGTIFVSSVFFFFSMEIGCWWFPVAFECRSMYWACVRRRMHHKNGPGETSLKIWDSVRPNLYRLQSDSQSAVGIRIYWESTRVANGDELWLNCFFWRGTRCAHLIWNCAQSTICASESTQQNGKTEKKTEWTMHCAPLLRTKIDKKL